MLERAAKKCFYPSQATSYLDLYTDTEEKWKKLNLERIKYSTEHDNYR